MYIIGIDPGAGSRSATGICVLDAIENKIMEVHAIWPENRKTKAYDRIRSISGQFLGVTAKYQKEECMLVNEHFVMRGKGGETLQRLTGALYACSPDTFEVNEISNMQLKQFIGGTGKADKQQVAKGVMAWFEAKHNLDDVERVMELVVNQQWDIIDSIAIAILGKLQYA